MLKNCKGFTFLFSENYRSRAYAQFFVQSGFLPDLIIFMGKEKQSPPKALQDVYIDPYSGYSFRPEQQVSETFRGIRHIRRDLTDVDINSKIFVEAANKLGIRRVIYSGKSGVLISARTLGQFTEVVHVHGGYLPDFRGSTTFYFSILAEGQIGASSILLNSEIDQGDVLVRQKFKPVSGINIDYVLDPLARANVLVKTLQKLSSQTSEGVVAKQDTDSGTTYQVIHPILKCKALKKLDGI